MYVDIKDKTKLAELSLELNNSAIKIDSEIKELQKILEENNLKNSMLSSASTTLKSNLSTTSKDLNTVSKNINNYVHLMNEIDNNDFNSNSQKNSEAPTTLSDNEETNTKNTFGQNLLSLLGGAIGEFLNLGEGVIDSHIYGTTKTINALGAKQLFDWNDNYDDKIIGYDVSDKIEGAITKNIPKKENGWNKTGAFIGKIGGYISLSMIPFVGTAVATFAGAGVKTESAYKKALEKEENANEWKVLFESFVGSLEGFAIGYGAKSKAGNLMKSNGKSIVTGAKTMFTKNGLGNGVKEFLKSTGPVFKRAGISSLKSPSTMTQTGAKVGNTVVSLLDGKGLDIKSIGDIFKKIPVRFWDNLGEAGLSYFINYK